MLSSPCCKLAGSGLWRWLFLKLLVCHESPSVTSPAVRGSESSSAQRGRSLVRKDTYRESSIVLLHILLHTHKTHSFRAGHIYPSGVGMQRSQNTGSNGTTGSTLYVCFRCQAMIDEWWVTVLGRGWILQLPTSTEGTWVCVTTSRLNLSAEIKLQKHPLQHER